MESPSEIVTFKATPSLVEAMQGITNRSAFIREAILAALDNNCPLCGGTGRLTPEQKQHWQLFKVRHRMAECRECHATHLVCAADAGAAGLHG